MKQIVITIDCPESVATELSGKVTDILIRELKTSDIGVSLRDKYGRGREE